MRPAIIEGWAIPKPVLWALLVAAVMECLGFLTNFPALFTVDGVDVGWTVVPCAIALGLAVRSRSTTTSRVERHRVIAFLSMGVVGVVFTGLYVTHTDLASASTVLVAVSVEEVVYRFAIPVLVVMCSLRFGVGKRVGLAIGLVVSLILFALLPGHQAQLTNVQNWVALVAFTVLMSHAVWRGRSLFAAVAAHAVYDFVNLGMQAGYVSAPLRLVAASVALAALVALAAKPKEAIIDLRDPKPQPVEPSAGLQNVAREPLV